MRILSVLLALSVTSTTAFAAAPAPRDEVLWSSISDLQQRLHFAKARRLSGDVALASSVAFVGGAALRNFTSQLLPRLAAVGGGVVATSWGATAALLMASAGYWIFDRYENQPGERFFWGGTLKQRNAVQSAVLSLNDLLSKPALELYEIALEDAELRQYIIEFDQWMRTGAAVGAPPVHPSSLSLSQIQK